MKLHAFRSKTLLKRISNTGVFQIVSQIFNNIFFYRIPLVAASGKWYTKLKY